MSATLTETAESNGHAVDGIATDVRNLETLSQNLDELVSRFRV